MRFQGFIGPTYTLQSVNVDCQRCINLYPEIDEQQTGAEMEVASLVSTPGLRTLATLPTGPVRGVFTDSLGNLWAVGGNRLYQVSNLWAVTLVGTLNTSEGPVSFCDNGIQVVLVDGPYGYSWTIGLASAASTATTTTSGQEVVLTASSASTQVFVGTLPADVKLPDVTTLYDGFVLTIINQSSQPLPVITSGQHLIQTMAQNTQLYLTCSNTLLGTGTESWTWTYSTGIFDQGVLYSFAVITDPNFQGATQVTFLDGYFIFNTPGSKEFYLSPLNAVTPFSGLDVATKEGRPDLLLGVLALQENLYLFGASSTEIWYDAGAATFPLARVPGSVLEIGCISAFSIAKINNIVFWLGRDQNGRGIVYSAQGLQPQRISTFSVEHEIATLGDLSGARAWTYQQSGHSFYCLNLPGAETTWVYDVSTNLWHERMYLSNGQFTRHLSDCQALAFDTNIVGDYSSGNIYALDLTVFTDNGNAILRERTAPHITKDMNRIFHSQFQLDVETGVGVDGGTQGTDPQAMLQWSNDHGHSWSNEHWTSIGAIGARLSRVIWRRLGHARDRVYRVRISDPVKVTLLGAEIDIEEGAA